MIDDATIKRVAQSFIADGCAKQCKQWGMGYEKDSDGEYNKPVVPNLIYEFARAIEQLARQEQLEDAKDAKRYRALIASGKYCPSSIGGYWALVTGRDQNVTKSEMDEAVDKAIRASGKENSNE